LGVAWRQTRHVLHLNPLLLQHLQLLRLRLRLTAVPPSR
jgi:hypothetical protein